MQFLFRSAVLITATALASSALGQHPCPVGCVHQYIGVVTRPSNNFWVYKAECCKAEQPSTYHQDNDTPSIPTGPCVNVTRHFPDLERLKPCMSYEEALKLLENGRDKATPEELEGAMRYIRRALAYPTIPCEGYPGLKVARLNDAEVLKIQDDYNSEQNGSEMSGVISTSGYFLFDFGGSNGSGLRKIYVQLFSALIREDGSDTETRYRWGYEIEAFEGAKEIQVMEGNGGHEFVAKVTYFPYRPATEVTFVTHRDTPKHEKTGCCKACPPTEAASKSDSGSGESVMVKPDSGAQRSQK